MRNHYDFSKGERGKFHQVEAKINLPIYLDAEVMAFVEEIARNRECEVAEVVNELLRGDMQLAKAMK